MKISNHIYKCLFQPDTIAVIGASNDQFKPGGRVTKNIKDNGYGGKLWAVNPKTPDILGLPTFQTIADLPATPDLAILGIPAKFAIQAVTDLATKGVKAVIVLTAGFGEKDDEGAAMEKEMIRIAETNEMALIGPNCSGFLTPFYKGKFAGIIPTLPGNAVDFISGSGATVDYVMENGTTRGLSFGTVINLGNSIMLSVEDMVEMYDLNYGPDSAKILLLYMEAVQKPKKLLTHARNLVSKGCSIVAIKSGATEAGQRAAASHTGAMASSDTAVDAMLKKAGIIRVQGRQELVETACLLTASRGNINGNRACIVTDAGGPGVMLTDELNRQGVVLPSLGEQTLKRLAEILPPESSLANPIDALPSRNADQFRDILQVLGENERENLDVIITVVGDSGMSDNALLYAAIAKGMQTCPIPVIPILTSLVSSKEHIDAFISGGEVFFADEVAMGQALGRIAKTRAPDTERTELPHYDVNAIKATLKNQSGALNPEQVSKILSDAGFPMPPQVEAFNESELEDGCEKIHFPLVMKVIGPLHKTDVGGVIVGVNSIEELRKNWHKLMAIDNAQGVLLQPMIQGPEVILGASREANFGHLLMFGLGGIYAEVLKDVSFSLAPVSASESMDMIKEIRSYKVIEGVRGEPGMNIQKLSDCVIRLGKLVSDFPQIAEIDLNPIKGVDKNLFAVDARIIVS